ncbi:hypothetical protein FNV43_RR09168 [Rhamnella rubrinervis]|uniref:BHLH domain-containing protein n=1 Tax=Rhamnella rubrinervis TaxID=2594499 RepID=A0A8K0HAP6_9ROSA|nr:hypothetical protein FNV43_RR09168 [Rhamnella rubrinervis]
MYRAFPSCQQQEHRIKEDQVPPTSCHDQDDHDQNHNPGFCRPRPRSSVSFDENGDHDQNPNHHHDKKKKKKVEHKHIERQRRQEMTNLHASLRSLLPLEYIKGKRSISDHVQEATNYIKDLQKGIQELSNKRDKLKNLLMNTSGSSNVCVAPLQNPHSRASDSIIVRSSSVGMEVMINTAFTEGLPLSRVVNVLIGEGLSIISCISVEVNERLLHTLESQVSGGRSIDPSELEQKLKKLQF